MTTRLFSFLDCEKENQYFTFTWDVFCSNLKVKYLYINLKEMTKTEAVSLNIWFSFTRFPLKIHKETMQGSGYSQVALSHSGKQRDASGSWHMKLSDSAAMLDEGHGPLPQTLSTSQSENTPMAVCIHSFLSLLFKYQYMDLFMAICPVNYLLTYLKCSPSCGPTVQRHITSVRPCGSVKMGKWLMVCRSVWCHVPFLSVTSLWLVWCRSVVLANVTLNQSVTHAPLSGSTLHLRLLLVILSWRCQGFLTWWKELHGCKASVTSSDINWKQRCNQFSSFKRLVCIRFPLLMNFITQQNN